MSKVNETIPVTTDYSRQLAEFVAYLIDTGPVGGGAWKIKSGRKYDKVFHIHPNELLEGRTFMVDRSNGTIYGTKSWTMINLRREFGTIYTFTEWNWVPTRPTPLPGTKAEAHNVAREAVISATYKKRGRPRKSTVLTS